MTGSDMNALISRMDQLIRLVGFQIGERYETVGEKALVLDRMGLDKKQIALICGTTPNAISARLLEAIKPKKAKKAKK